MQEVHVDQPALRGRLEVAATCSVGELKDETSRAQHKSCQKRGDGTRTIETWPEDSENKACGNRRTDVSLNALQIDVKLSADISNERDPEEAEQNHHAGAEPAEIDELRLRGLRANRLLPVQRHTCPAG